MTTKETEAVAEKTTIISQLATDVDSAIKMTDDNIASVCKELEKLREQKAQLQTKKAIESLGNGKYYRLHDRFNCESYYFHCTKENFYVQDMTNTVGYDGENKIFIHYGLRVMSTRARYQAGIFNTMYFPLSQFERMDIEEISAEDFRHEIESITKCLLSEMKMEK